MGKLKSADISADIYYSHLRDRQTRKSFQSSLHAYPFPTPPHTNDPPLPLPLPSPQSLRGMCHGDKGLVYACVNVCMYRYVYAQWMYVYIHTQNIYTYAPGVCHGAEVLVYAWEGFGEWQGFGEWSQGVWGSSS